MIKMKKIYSLKRREVEYMQTVNSEFKTSLIDNKVKKFHLNNKLSSIEEIMSYGIMRSKLLNRLFENYIIKNDNMLIQELFRKNEKEKSNKQTRLLLEEKERIRELHYGKCPQCGLDLQEVNFMNNMIWLCEECSAIWLHHEEVEAIIAQRKSGFWSNIWNNKNGLLGAKLRSLLELMRGSPVKKKTKADKN